MKLERVIISGGGTGGHIFPAIAIADEIKHRYPTCDILFIGALGKMEMEKVPQAGYAITGLDIRGFQRRLTLSNFALPYKIVRSLLKARSVLKAFQPQVVIGVGGYASGPTLQMANLLNIPTILQEQNSFAGKTNRILSKKAKAICVAYEGMDYVFDAKKIHLTGNPVRENALPKDTNSGDARLKNHLDPNKPTILVIGGSLGAKTLNDSVLNNRSIIEESGCQILWQTGKYYEKEIQEIFKKNPSLALHPVTFIHDMAAAYTAADIIVSRAGALSVSELCIVGKPAILVPSPNVAEDHQTKNAMALVNKNAAVLVKDADARTSLIQVALTLLENNDRRQELAKNIQSLGKPNATLDIVNVIEENAQ